MDCVELCKNKRRITLRNLLILKWTKGFTVESIMIGMIEGIGKLNQSTILGYRSW